MQGTDSAFYHSVSQAFDGDEPVSFERLPLASPAVERALGRDFIIVSGRDLAALAERAFSDIQFRLRPSLVARLAGAAYAPDTDERDRYVARALLDNALESSGGTYPLCQDTGTATVYGWKGDRVLVDSDDTTRGDDATRGDATTRGDDTIGDDDADVLERGALAAWASRRLRNSQVAPLPDFNERNTGDNAPVSTHIASVRGDHYRFLFIAKGGGSANKAALFQETKRLLRPDSFYAFAERAIASLGVSACPPYRIAIALGGQSAEEATLAAKLASAGALDALPSAPDASGGPFRDRALESVVTGAAERSGWGAQFGGRFMARDARVVRLPRHAASLPVAVAVSCSAHRQAYAYVSRDGYFVERLALGADIERIMRAAEVGNGKARSAVIGRGAAFGAARRVELGEPGSTAQGAAIASLRSGELVELWGKVVLARDAVHARLLSMLERGERLPEWTRYPAFYASPTETPAGRAIGSIGPTTARRMDSYLDEFGTRGIFPLTIGKGERGPECAAACAKHGGAYLAAVGGAAALAAKRYVRSCATIDWPELGMEAVRLVELSGLPALVATDSAGRDYYKDLR